MGGTLLVLTGCASGPNGQLMSWRLTDPPQLSPFSRPLTAPNSTNQPHDVGRPAQEPLVPPDDELTPPTTVRQKPADNLTPAPESQNRRDTHDLTAPSPSEEALKTPYADPELAKESTSPLQLTVFAPASAVQGDDVTFQITVQNTQSINVEDVKIICRLPDGLDFLDFPERASQNRLGSLEAQQERALDLTLKCSGVGRLCVSFEATAPGTETVTESVCVECTSPAASSTNPPIDYEPLELTGPTERTIGSRAEFVITLRNITGVEQPNVHVVLRHEGVLESREASAGAVRKPGRLEWDLGMLRIDERVQIQVEFECLSLAEETCVSATVTGRDLDLPPVEACLKTTPQGEVDLDIVDGQDPITMGEKVTYVIQVTNAGLQQLSNASVQLLADGLQPVGLTVDNKPVSASVAFDRASGLITIPLSENLNPDASQTISLQALATRPGAGGLRALLTQDGTPLSVTTTEPTVINPLGNSVAWDRR